MERARIARDGHNDYDVDAIEDGLARGAQAANGSRAGPRFNATAKIAAKLDLLRHSRSEATVSAKIQTNVYGGCKAIPLPCPVTVKEEPVMTLNGSNPTTVPLVNFLEDCVQFLEPPVATNGNLKKPFFAEIDGVATGICDWSHTEAREQLMGEAADLLLRGFVPGPGIEAGNGKRGLWMFDSVRFKQLRPAMTAHERASDRFDLWQQDQIIFGEEVAAQVKPVAEEAIS